MVYISTPSLVSAIICLIVGLVALGLVFYYRIVNTPGPTGPTGKATGPEGDAGPKGPSGETGSNLDILSSGTFVNFYEATGSPVNLGATVGSSLNASMSNFNRDSGDITFNIVTDSTLQPGSILSMTKNVPNDDNLRIQSTLFNSPYNDHIGYETSRVGMLLFVNPTADQYNDRDKSKLTLYPLESFRYA